MTVTTYTDDTVEKKTPICTTDKGQDACFLRIDSSEGAIFRNGQGATKLTVTVVNGRESITTIAGLRAKFGNGVKIVWKEKRVVKSAIRIFRQMILGFLMMDLP